MTGSNSHRPATNTGAGNENAFHSLSVPTYRGSTILYPDYESFVNRGKLGRHAYNYGLSGTPTSRTLESRLSELENAADTFLVPSGLMAITTTLLTVASAGDCILLPDTVYAPVRRFAATTLQKLGVKVDYYNPLDPDTVAFDRPDLRLIWVESPGSVTMEVQDLPEIVTRARAHGVLVGCDNSWASPHFCKPLDLGADIVVEAVTKYLSGHSDLLLGSISVANESLAEQIYDTIKSIGVGVSPDDCFLAIRGLQSAKVRLTHIENTARRLAETIQSATTVSKVLHPALQSFPTHNLWARQFSGSSGVFSFVMNDEADHRHAARFERLKTIQIGASWGGTHSLIAPSPVSPNIRTVDKTFLGKRLVRLSVGLEDTDLLAADVDAFLG